MDQIPYELLQMIASWLLPRSQCRLAITSRHCYRYLYTDLLRWHARKDAISLPKHKYKKYGNETLCVIQTGEKIVLYETTKIYKQLCAFNLTTLTTCKITGHNTIIAMTIDDILILLRYYKSLDILNGCYKYMHSVVIGYHIDTKNPLMSLPSFILRKIYKKLDKNDRGSMTDTCYYMWWLIK